MRVPVSIQPGDDTKKGWGATVSMTMQHDFGPRFLPRTYRNLVINDLVDILGPYVYELIRSGKAEKYDQNVKDYIKAKNSAISASRSKGGAQPTQTNMGSNSIDQQKERNILETLDDTDARKKAYSNLDTVLTAAETLKSSTVYTPVSRTGGRVLAIAPSDVKRIFVEQNVLNLAFATQQALDLGDPKAPAHDVRKVRANDVRTYLRHELEAAYDLMEGRCRDQGAMLDDVAYVEDLTNQVYCRRFEGPKGVPVDTPEERNEFYNLYESFTNRIPGNLRFRPIGVLSWGIVIEAGLLNRQLQEDMKATKGADGYVCPAEVDGMVFYTPEPAPDVVTTFQEYVKARWPMITFALEPVTDQQNIQDAFTRRRDLQLAVAFALSSGRMSFRQATRFTRQLQYEAQTIALNQTVSAFAHGTDTFGWRFTPRFQTPPEESNFATVTNLLGRGGPGPNYGLRNSKIEPGMRELTAVVVMPSFVPAMRLDVSSDWFRLHDPDDQKLHTARSIELGRRINEAREALEAACQCGLYRPEDIQRLRTRLHQLEISLPLQTQFVKVPYENTLGGFALFTQGTTALVPELTGFEGVEYLDPTRTTEVIVYGKHFSIYENALVVGGQSLVREGTAATTVPLNASPTASNPAFVSSTVTPFRDASGDLIVLNADGSTTKIKDGGSYDILSREVMRVRIPPNIYISKREDGSEVVELYLSTPNGISNRLQIPVRPKVEVTVVAGPAFTSLGATVPIRVSGTINGVNVVPSGFDVADIPQLLIQPTGLPTPLPDSVDLAFTLSLPTTPASTSGVVTIPGVAINKTRDAYAVTKPQLNAFAARLFDRFKTVPLTSDWVTRSIIVSDSSDASRRFSIVNPPKITFGFVVPTAAADPAPVAPVAATPPATRDPLAGRAALTPSPRGESGVTRASFAGEAGERELEQLPPLPLDLDEIAAPAAVATRASGFTLTPAPGGLGGFVLTPNAAGSTPLTIAPTAAARPAAPASPVVVLPPQQQSPTINVNVPVTNNMPAKKHMSLFRRQPQSATPPPVRGPLLERLRGNP